MYRMKHAPMAAALAAIVFLAPGCGAPKPVATEISARIYKMGEAGDWAGAMPLATQFALAWPRDPAAHYLLGKAYLHSAVPALAQADGEFLTAQSLLGRKDSLASVMWATSEEFRLAIHRDLALVDFRWIREAMRLNFPPQAIHARLIQARGHVEAGLKLSPSDASLKQMHATIDEYLAGPYQDAPSAAPAS